MTSKQNTTEEQRFRASAEFRLLELLFGKKKKEIKMSECKHDWNVGNLLRRCQKCGRVETWYGNATVKSWELLTPIMFDKFSDMIGLVVYDKGDLEEKNIIDCKIKRLFCQAPQTLAKIEDMLNKHAGLILKRRRRQLQSKVNDCWVITRNNDPDVDLIIETLGEHIFRNRKALKYGESLPRERIIGVYLTREECNEF